MCPFWQRHSFQVRSKTARIKTPVLSDLRESGSLEQDADIVMLINRPYLTEKDHPERNKTKLSVAKHRNGPIHSGIELVLLSHWRCSTIYTRVISLHNRRRMSVSNTPLGFERDQTKNLALPADFLRSLAQSRLDREAILIVLNFFDLLDSADNLAVESSVMLEAAEMLLMGKKKPAKARLRKPFKQGLFSAIRMNRTRKCTSYRERLRHCPKWLERFTSGQEN